MRTPEPGPLRVRTSLFLRLKSPDRPHPSPFIDPGPERENFEKFSLAMYIEKVDSIVICCEFWFRSGKKKIEKQKKIPDEFIMPTSPLSISPGAHDPCSRKVLI